MTHKFKKTSRMSEPALSLQLHGFEIVKNLHGTDGKIQKEVILYPLSKSGSNYMRWIAIPKEDLPALIKKLKLFIK